MGTSPGVVVANEFSRSEDGGYGEYAVDYSDREEAVTRPWEQAYASYFFYMENPRKSTGLFTRDKDSLQEEDKTILKQIFDTAERNGSPLYRPIISFDNEWLEQNGLYSKENGWLDEKTLKIIVREAVEKGIKKEELTNAVWTAAFHFNTDNIHCHVSCVEPIPTRSVIQTGEYAGEYRGKFKLSTLYVMKGSVANAILMQQPENLKINDIIRNKIIDGYKQNPLYQNREFLEQFISVYELLPENKRNWNYGMNTLSYLRSDIDDLSKAYIDKYHKEEFKELQHLLQDADQNYRRAYGDSKLKSFYSDGKINDLYKRLGNQILKSMKEYDKIVKEDRFAKATETHKGLTQNRRPAKEDYYKNKYKDKSGKWHTKKSSERLKYKSKTKFHSNSSLHEFGKLADSLLQAMETEYINVHNQFEHEIMVMRADLHIDDELSPDN